MKLSSTLFQNRLHAEVLVNSFESASTETDQLEIEQRNIQTVLPEPEPVSISIPVPATPEIVSSALETELEIETEIKTEIETELEAETEEAITTTDRPKSNETVEMESFPKISTELAYSCLLIPRFSDHYLTGDITRDLVTWMKEVCISYGWRLDAITIRPGYLQWVMTVPLTTNPAQFMRLTRQQTSKKILEDYPRFKIKNLSPDFWAPGFSVVHGNSLQSTEDINSYILQIRKQQGIF